MLKFSWYSGITCIFFLTSLIVASKQAASAQAIWLYYVYAAECKVYGSDATNFLPWSTKKGSPQFTLYQFIRDGLVASNSAGKTTPKNTFVAGYAADIDKAKPILDTITPNLAEAELYLKNCGYFSGLFDNVRLFGEMPVVINKLPQIAELVINRFQHVRQYALQKSAEVARAIEGDRQLVIESMQLTYNWRQVENTGIITALKDAPLIVPALRDAPLNVITVDSPVSPGTKVLDLAQTIEQSPDLTDAQRNAVIAYLQPENARGKLLKVLTNHFRGIAAFNTHLGRVINDDPEC